ncbi:MAG: hypothetical protein AABY83_15235 [Pseudomonadota bacterium]
MSVSNQRTTLRVRIPVAERPTLEILADAEDVAYREFLAHVLRQAVRADYRPRSMTMARDTRVTVAPETKMALRALAHSLGLSPENYVLAVLRDLCKGEFKLI